MISHFGNMILLHSSNSSPETFTQYFKSDLFSEVQKCHHKKRSKHILGEINDYNYLV